MHPTLIHDKATLEAHLLKHPQRNFYHLGDLDDFFWPYTAWYGWQPEDNLEAVLLFYIGIDPPVLLAIENNNQAAMERLLAAALPFLPPRFYSHLSPGLEDILRPNYTLNHHGPHDKMGLTHPSALDAIDTRQVVTLTPADVAPINELFAAAYPGNWFDPRMLDTGQYTGIWRGSQLVSIAGIHVYSKQYKIAALGNITTHPDHRGQGLGAAVTAGLCQQLLNTVDHIGLNVKSDNAAAIHVYQKLGFEKVAVYHEWMVEQK